MTDVAPDLALAAADSWLTPSAAARALGLSVKQVHNLSNAGRLRCMRTVLGRLIDPASVADEVKRREK